MVSADVFSLVNTLAMVMWVLMIAIPNWRGTQFLIKHKIVPVLLSVIYAIYIVRAIQEGGMMDFSSLDSVMDLFTKEQAVLAGWVHYLAFDLLIGIWIIQKSKQLDISHWLIIPFLFASFFLGPVGFLLFYILRLAKSK